MGSLQLWVGSLPATSGRTGGASSAFLGLRRRRFWTRISLLTRLRLSLADIGLGDILFLAALEVSFIPPAPLEAETGSRDQLLQGGSSAGRAIRQWGITDLLQFIHVIAASEATVFIDWHRLIPDLQIARL